MTDNDTFSTMRRKAGAGRAPPEIGVVTTNSALRVAVAQAAEDELGLTVSATSVKEERVTLAILLENLPENTLFALCQREAGDFGLITLDPNSLAALLEVQTMGQVSPNPANARPPTRTDALLCSGFLDQVLCLFQLGAADANLTISPCISGYKYVQPLADTRAIEMTLIDCPYRLFTLEIDFDNGVKSGRMQILLPFSEPVSDKVETNHAWEFDLANAIDCAHVELEAVLARKELQFSEITALEVGSVITLSSKSVREIVVVDMNGASVSLGRLGQAAGMRAVCIAQPCHKTETQIPTFAMASNTLAEPGPKKSAVLSTQITPSINDMPDVPKGDVQSPVPSPALPEILDAETGIPS